ncbi:MAG TPA: SIMPL domain-containing protein, partial [Steroidobacteraceae bacterium]|nr:SIMPL domain-containing protein [Steroidobacteraceae bacterium]
GGSPRFPAPPPSLSGRVCASPATIRVTGQAKVSKAPDRVYIDIGVTTQAPKSGSAAAQNARRLAAVIAAVKRAAGFGAQLATTEYSISPSYEYPQHGAAAIVGYTASNVVRVRLDDLRKMGAVLDAATREGSNEVRDIRFAVRDEEGPRTQALRKAALAARQDAQALADALGLRIVRVLWVGEQSPAVGPPPIYPLPRRFAAATVAPPTPVEPGTIAVNATVTLTVEVAPARR